MPSIKQRGVCHSFIKLGYVDYYFSDVFVGRTLDTYASHEIMRFEIAVFATADVAVIHIIALCALLTGRRAAFRRMSQIGVFISAIFAESEVRISTVVVSERSEFVLMPRRGKIFRSAHVALCAA